jgi:transposase InsO family protein
MQVVIATAQIMRFAWRKRLLTVRYIEFWYNSKRRRSGLQYRTPQQVHDEYLEQQSAA